MITDRIGDFIIRLQNAAMSGKREVRVPHSRFLETIAKKLKELGFISTVSVQGDAVKKTLELELTYDATGVAKLRGVKRVSSPGRRLYAAAHEAHTVKGGTGARLLTTPAGVLTDREARKARVGGEDLFEIW